MRGDDDDYLISDSVGSEDEDSELDDENLCIFEFHLKFFKIMLLDLNI